MDRKIKRQAHLQRGPSMPAGVYPTSSEHALEGAGLPKLPKIRWQESDFRKYVILRDGGSIFQLIQQNAGLEMQTFFDATQTIPLYRDLAGAQIEASYLSFYEVSIRKILEFLTDFLYIDKHWWTSQTQLIERQDLHAVQRWVERYQLGVMLLASCTGYALNHELVTLEWEMPYTSLGIKFKGEREDVYYICHFSLTLIQARYYLVIEKST